MQIQKIYLSWRLGKGKERRLVGTLQRLTNGFSFHYNEEALKQAQQEGFANYVAFPDTATVYTEGVIEVFSRRLTQKSRADSKYFFEFWHANQAEYDDFDKLALTQGALPTDNFEFLADYKPQKDFMFVTDIAGLSLSKLPPNIIKLGDILTYKLESYQTDEYAVKIMKDKTFIGYIKRGHNQFFHNLKDLQPLITVKDVDYNGVIKQIFIDVKL
jgi:hypothetical protein